jgi:hypothetical protein
MPRISWGKTVGELLVGSGISTGLHTALASVYGQFKGIINKLLDSFTRFIPSFYHYPKNAFQSVNFQVIPIFHTTNNNEQQNILTYLLLGGCL